MAGNEIPGFVDKNMRRAMERIIHDVFVGAADLWGLLLKAIISE